MPRVKQLVTLGGIFIAFAGGLSTCLARQPVRPRTPPRQGVSANFAAVRATSNASQAGCADDPSEFLCLSTTVGLPRNFGAVTVQYPSATERYGRQARRVAVSSAAIGPGWGESWWGWGYGWRGPWAPWLWGSAWWPGGWGWGWGYPYGWAWESGWPPDPSAYLDDCPVYPRVEYANPSQGLWESPSCLEQTAAVAEPKPALEAHRQRVPHSRARISSYRGCYYW